MQPDLAACRAGWCVVRRRARPPGFRVLSPNDYDRPCRRGQHQLMPYTPCHRTPRPHPHGRGAPGRRLAVALLIPLGTVGGLAALGSGPGVASAAGGCGGSSCSGAPAAGLTGYTGDGPAASGDAQFAGAEPSSAVAGLIDEVFPPSVRQRARAIAWCESRMEPDVVGARNSNGTHDWGVFQLNDGGTLQYLGGTPQTALDARWNVLAAKRLYDRLGFRPWSCQRA